MRLLLILLFLLPYISTDRTVACTDGFSLINNKCLKLFTTPMSRRNATGTCSSYAGSLVTIKSVEDNHAVAAIVGNSTKRVWIGLYCFDNDMSNCLWDDESGSAESYNNFAYGFPYTDIDNCVYYKVTGKLTGKWLNGDCDEDLRSFVCEIPTTFEENCGLNYNGSCYFTSGHQSGIDDARGFCEDMCGKFISIHSSNEIRFIKNYLKTLNIPSVFIGALPTSRKHYTWMDGSAWDYNNIDKSNNNYGNCIMMALKTNGSVTEGFWYNTNCQDKRHYMCKRPAGVKCNTESPPVPDTTTHSLLDYSDCNYFFKLSGSFASPNYPGNYTHNLTCSYMLATLGSNRIRLTFSEINMEPSFDRILIYDGDSTHSPLIANLTARLDTPLYYESNSNTMYMTFNTDHSVSGPGFSANFLSII